MPIGKRSSMALTLAVLVHRNGRLVAVLDGPDDVLGTERRIAAEEHAIACAHHRRLVDDGTVPFVELDADVALDPGERIVLANRQHNVVTRYQLLARHGAAIDAPFSSMLYSMSSKFHADELAVLVDELLWVND